MIAAQASSKWWDTASHPNSERSSLTGGPELLLPGEGGQPRMRPRSHMSHSPSSTTLRPPEVQAGMGLPACMPGCIKSMPHQASLTLSGAVQVQTSASQIEITLGSYLRSGCHAQLLLLSCATLLRLPAVSVLHLSFNPCVRKRAGAPSLCNKQGLASPSLQR